MPEAVDWRTVVEDFRDAAQRLYGARLKRLILFGSRARGDDDQESDVDLLVVLDNLEDYWTELRQIQNLAYDLSFGRDRPVLLSVLLASESEYPASRIPLFFNVRREGKDLF